MDNTLHVKVKKDGRIFQMLDGFSGKPMPFKDGRHNYTKKDYDLEVGKRLVFKPMFGNLNPVYSVLVRIK